MASTVGSDDAKVRGAIDRAFTFKNRSNVHAFCIFFGEIVVVEFSDTGNAAFVYGRTEFETSFGSRLQTSRIADPGELKRRPYVHRIVHAVGWQLGAERWLATRGILPARDDVDPRPLAKHKAWR